MNYIRKVDFYNKLSNLRHKLDFDDNTYRVDFIALCRKKGIDIGAVPFFTSGLRGMASLGDGIQKDAIVLNTARNKFEQNVDCAHEFIHINFHKNEGYQSFKCFDKAQPNQNEYLEWQANEGSAELVVPYRSLLPKIKKNHRFLNTYTAISCFKEELVQEYCVTNAVIEYRLEALKYEIDQFVNGVSLNDLCILSQTSQRNQGICVKSLNDIAFEDLGSNFEEIYDLTDSKWTSCIIIQEWKDILCDMGGVIRASLSDTDIKHEEDNCFNIIFKNYNNYLIGSRTSVISELEGYILKKYTQTVHFNTQFHRSDEVYINSKESRNHV